ncbi:uncharacterized protein TRAVEDRAFT_52770 [Trametes versicolor FP-101664 SS1]|uniref:uncharacterized protein n=1 Tax=Trametes versicolor (strain FP-101664) TaxID=717944 RepID=UPI0004623C0E|nr:uncharacterized protein TRAVEDRAFT_52770 [Trametes versicolor FP-101664 SS1]EIW53652.1 hypothetical protein TRAVEDRAFT_52770 [Trametes versicolor FP-101664 SS1]
MPSTNGASSMVVEPLPHDHGSLAAIGPHAVESSTLTMGDPGVATLSTRLDSPPVLDQISLSIDKVANDMQLGPHYRAMLHRFKQAVFQLPPQHRDAFLIQQAVALRSIQLLEDQRRDIQDIIAFSATIRTHLADRRTLSADQQAEITALCKKMVFEADRTDYDFADEALERLRRLPRPNMFVEVFESVAWTQTLTTSIRRQSSYARNSLRKDLRDSEFDGKKKAGLTSCARKGLRKYAPRDGQDLSPELIFHLAILRRFVREHRDLLNRDESVDDTEDTSAAITGPKRKRVRFSEDSETFWGAVSAFFSEKNAEWGRSIKPGSQWANYIDECILQERRRFPDDRILAIAQRPSQDDAARPPSLPEFTFTFGHSPSSSRSPTPGEYPASGAGRLDGRSRSVVPGFTFGDQTGTQDVDMTASEEPQPSGSAQPAPSPSPATPARFHNATPSTPLTQQFPVAGVRSGTPVSPPRPASTVHPAAQFGVRRVVSDSGHPALPPVNALGLGIESLTISPNHSQLSRVGLDLPPLAAFDAPPSPAYGRYQYAGPSYHRHGYGEAEPYAQRFP